MSIANQKGGFNVTLRVTQNSSSESLCVLQKPLLKKAENWSLQVTDLFVNSTPPLNRQMGEQFRIHALEVGGAVRGLPARRLHFHPEAVLHHHGIRVSATGIF